MNLLRASIGALLLSACNPELVDLVTFGADAAGATTLDAGSPGESDLDAGRDLASDARAPNADLDARVRVEAGVDGGRPCTSRSDCASGQACELTGCGSKSGLCVTLQPFCNEKHEPECGCDGFTYYSPCLRRKYGVARDVDCKVMRANCERAGCPAHPVTGELTYCSHYLDDRTQCRQQSLGERICYVLPQACPSFTDGDAFSWCEPPMGSTGGAGGGTGIENSCMSKCEAIKLPSQVPQSWGVVPVFPFATAQRDRCQRTGPGGGVFPQP
jgi:hypothetical protein